MARTITLYRIFVASPSDLNDERNLIAEIVDEINLASFNTSDVKIELLKWETHANPGIGNYPQEVINNDINEYDIFIGLLWSRFGTSTRSYDSGTEEEFSIAYKKYQANPDSIKIMFYFKQAPIQFDKIDTVSINSIRNFKAGLGEKGVFYWEYNTVEEFQKLLRIQLTRKIQELQLVETKATTTILKEQSEIIEDELGLLDYMELGEDSFKEVVEIIQRMTVAIEWIGIRFTERAEVINRQTALNPEMGNKAKKRLVNSSANDLHSFNQRLKTEIPLFAETYKKGIDSYSNGIKISMDFLPDKEEEIEDTINSIDIFIAAIEQSTEICEGFKKTIDELPRMTKEFNSAKRIGSGILFEMISEFDISINLAKALKSEFEEYKSKY
jgi:hypothetical protein